MSYGDIAWEAPVIRSLCGQITKMLDNPSKSLIDRVLSATAECFSRFGKNWASTLEIYCLRQKGSDLKIHHVLVATFLDSVAFLMEGMDDSWFHDNLAPLIRVLKAESPAFSKFDLLYLSNVIDPDTILRYNNSSCLDDRIVSAFVTVIEECKR